MRRFYLGLVHTHLWVHIFKDKKGAEAKRIQIWLDEREAVLTRFNQLELLQGCRDNKELLLLSSESGRSAATNHRVTKSIT